MRRIPAATMSVQEMGIKIIGSANKISHVVSTIADGGGMVAERKGETVNWLIKNTGRKSGRKSRSRKRRRKGRGKKIHLVME